MKLKATRKFTNELSNDITIEVYKDNKDADIFIIGPNSTAELLLTRGEAYELTQALNRIDWLEDGQDEEA